MAENKFREKRAQLDILEKLIDYLNSINDDYVKEYRAVGKEEEQARHWKTDELLWEDEEKTIPKYRDKYDYVVIPKDELTDDQKAHIKAITEVIKYLEKLL